MSGSQSGRSTPVTPVVETAEPALGQTEPPPPLTLGRLPFARSELRGRTVRGVAVNTIALVLVEGLNLALGVIVARLLGPSEIGLYGIVSITVTTLIALKRVGIDEAYVAQDEADQKHEFALAFTLELALSIAFALAIVVAAPIIAAVYGNSQLVGLMAAMAYLPIAFALQAPAWIYFRRMDFVRQRTLLAIVPVVTFVVTVPLAAVGVGVWSLVIGAAAGNAAAVLVALRNTPFPLRIRYERSATKRYLAFSLPVFAVTLGGLIVGQGQVLVFNIQGGLVATGFISLALVLTMYANRADQVISPAIYPVICALRDATSKLEALFETACRASAVWGLGLGAAFVLFSPDVVALLLGSAWNGATVLLQGLAVVAALYQLGFCWIAFARGMGQPGKPAVEAFVAVAIFGAVAVPALFELGQDAFVAAMILQSVAILVVRGIYLHRLLPGVRIARLLARCFWPLVPACTAVAVVRLALWGGQREVAQFVLEIVVFIVVYVAATWRWERNLLREFLGELRGQAAAA